ncbi:MAG: DUF86 domain-containing protein [Candidatus Aminicenantales bacterium]
MVDLEKIKYRIAEIKENLHKIKKYASLADKEFWADERNILSVKHLLLVSIEACGNICVHISAKKIFKAASSFAECFENLYKEGVIEENLSDRLRNMARFRNILVHRYWDIDERKILDYARNNLDDFDQFLKAIVKYLDI